MQVSRYIFFAFIVIVLIVLYFLYNDIAGVKKLATPMFRKTIALEAKVTALDKNVTVLKHGDGSSGNDSPIMELSYRSDAMPRRNNIGFTYAQVTNSEATKIKKDVQSISGKIEKGSVSVICPIEKSPVSKSEMTASERKIIVDTIPSDFGEESENTTFDVDLSKVTKNKNSKNKNSKNKNQLSEVFEVSEVSDSEDILGSLDECDSPDLNSELKSSKINKKVMKNITRNANSNKSPNK